MESSISRAELFAESVNVVCRNNKQHSHPPQLVELKSSPTIRTGRRETGNVRSAVITSLPLAQFAGFVAHPSVLKTHYKDRKRAHHKDHALVKANKGAVVEGNKGILVKETGSAQGAERIASKASLVVGNVPSQERVGVDPNKATRLIPSAQVPLVLKAVNHARKITGGTEMGMGINGILRGILSLNRTGILENLPPGLMREEDVGMVVMAGKMVVVVVVMGETVGMGAKGAIVMRVEVAGMRAMLRVKLVGVDMRALVGVDMRAMLHPVMRAILLSVGVMPGGILLNVMLVMLAIGLPPVVTVAIGTVGIEKVTSKCNEHHLIGKRHWTARGDDVIQTTHSANEWLLCL